MGVNSNPRFKRTFLFVQVHLQTHSLKMHCTVLLLTVPQCVLFHFTRAVPMGISGLGYFLPRVVLQAFLVLDTGNASYPDRKH